MPLDGAAAERDVRERLISYLARRSCCCCSTTASTSIDAAAGLTDDILGRCPDVTVLATSREALAVPDEVQVNVGPLDTPPEGTPAGQVLDYPAAQLFVERARAVRPGTVFDERRPARRSAASAGPWTASRSRSSSPPPGSASMSPVEIADRLDHRFSLLTSGSRTAEARQQTLRATVDWSYALLSERRAAGVQPALGLPRRLDAGRRRGRRRRRPMRPDGVVLDTIARLVERSMVRRRARRAPPATGCWRRLRQYAAERLADVR